MLAVVPPCCRSSGSATLNQEGSCEDFSSVWSDVLVNSVKIEDDGDATDFENVDDFETLFNFNDNK